MDPFDLMLESINKIGDKNFAYTREELEVAIVGKSLALKQSEVGWLAKSREKYDWRS